MWFQQSWQVSSSRNYKFARTHKKCGINLFFGMCNYTNIIPLPSAPSKKVTAVWKYYWMKDNVKKLLAFINWFLHCCNISLPCKHGVYLGCLIISVLVLPTGNSFGSLWTESLPSLFGIVHSAFCGPMQWMQFMCGIGCCSWIGHSETKKPPHGRWRLFYRNNEWNNACNLRICPLGFLITPFVS